MRITIRLSPHLAQQIGKKEIIVEKNQLISIENTLKEMILDHPALNDEIFESSGKIHTHILLFVNGNPITQKNGLETQLKEGDKLDIMVALAGGT